MSPKRSSVYLMTGPRYQKLETESLQKAKLRKLSAEENLTDIELKETEGQLISRQEIFEAI